MLLSYLGIVKSKFMIKSIEEMYIWRTSRILVNDIYRMMRDCKDGDLGIRFNVHLLVS